eukprot:521108-Pyramimonas_sp.AAC.1
MVTVLELSKYLNIKRRCPLGFCARESRPAQYPGHRSRRLMWHWASFVAVEWHSVQKVTAVEKLPPM